jgi:hypothetical protein
MFLYFPYSNLLNDNMKAILIDALNKTITEIEIDGDLKSIYKAVGFDMIEIGFRFDDEGHPNNVIYLDEEGGFRGHEHGFFFSGAHQPWLGNGIIMGGDDEGESADTTVTIEEVRNRIRFLSPEQVKNLQDFYN